MTDTPADAPDNVPAAFNGSVNGSPTPAQRTADGIAAIAGMLPQLPQAIGGIVQQVLQQTSVQTRQHLCAQCIVTRMTWNLAHSAELAAALGAAAEAAGLNPDDPRAAQLDPAPFLPEHLQIGQREGIPQVRPAVTTVGGTEVCSEHIPNRPGGQRLLVANAAFSPSMLAGLG